MPRESKRESFLTSQRRKLEKQRSKKVEEFKSRIEVLEERIIGIDDPEDIMIEIIDVLDDVEIVPSEGNYYTFIYNAKTPDILYDQHPLVAVTKVFRWGFRGVNFHWGDYRNYTWQEIAGNLHIVENDEIIFMRNINYAKFLRSF